MGNLPPPSKNRYKDDSLNYENSGVGTSESINNYRNSYESGSMHHKRNNEAPWLFVPENDIYARDLVDPTGRVLIETRPYIITRFHHGAWVGMAILAAVLLILCALFVGLTLGVCGLDATLLQLRCVTGTPRERYEITPCARVRHADKPVGDKHVWLLA
jgi:hypothetical protein